MKRHLHTPPDDTDLLWYFLWIAVHIANQWPAVQINVINERRETLCQLYRCNCRRSILPVLSADTEVVVTLANSPSFLFHSLFFSLSLRLSSASVCLPLPVCVWPSKQRRDERLFFFKNTQVALCFDASARVAVTDCYLLSLTLHLRFYTAANFSVT